jgi:type II secretory pathway component GspD/PulD (secretin)
MKVTSDPRTNTIIIEAVPELLSKFKSIIEKLDTPTPQVRIAVKVIEATESFNYDVGVKWGTNLFLDSARGLGFGGLPFPKSAASNLAIDVPSTSANTATIGARLGSLSNGVNLDAIIGFSELRQNAKILQNTSVLVLDQQPATIVAGTTDYFEMSSVKTAGGETSASLVDIQYNLTLNVTPAISADGSVGMNVKLDADTPLQTTAKSAVAGKANKRLNTFMIRKSGETAVIGGVYTTKKDDVVRAVPFFSKIPIIGWLFKSNKQEMKKTELIIFVTPTIVAAGKSDESSRGATFVETAPVNPTYAAQGSLDENQSYDAAGAENAGSQMNMGSQMNAGLNPAQNSSNSAQNSSQNSGNNQQSQNYSQVNQNQSSSGNNSSNSSNNNSGNNSNNSSNQSDNAYNSGEDQL